MKLIEKLAQECSHLLWGNAEHDDPPANLAKDAFEAGFRKARGMAAELAESLVDDGWFEMRPEIEKLGENPVDPGAT